jgi:hypothetical protein
MVDLADVPIQMTVEVHQEGSRRWRLLENDFRVFLLHLRRRQAVDALDDNSRSLIRS